MEPKERYNRAVETLKDKAADGRVSPEDYRLIMLMAHAYDPEHPRLSPGDDSTKAHSTLSGYVNYLSAWSERVNYGLSNATPEKINRTVLQIRSDNHEGWDDPSQNTVKSYTDTLRKFFRYHTDQGFDADRIEAVKAPDTQVDERDIFDRDDIEAMRNVIDNPRDRCLFELFLNTGQRLRALQTLQWKDVDLDERVFYLADTTGLKGADQNGRKRPLLGAREYVRQWKEYHPNPQPDAYVLTHRRKQSWKTRGDEYQHLQASTIRRLLKTIAEKAGVEKPAHPHNFRHTFVTIARADYDMNPDTIRWILGHGDGSRVMETTYSHLSADDYIEDAEVSQGIREPSDGRLTPAECTVCGKPLGPQAKACERCGEVYAPDARAVEQQLDDQMKESYKQADPDDDETMDKIDQLDDLLDDPEVKTALLEKLQNE